ncbi:hypothetical protein HDU78_009280 [Chytriomyces hyalinus]|nr:hypothetical protein HDU78_009280 [Chytriomyces hyalinus]
MGGYTMGLGAKAPGLLKNRLPADVIEPMTKFGDPIKVDSSPEHRAHMRSVLYGPERENKKFPSGFEVGDHSADYADEKPPAWITNHATDYPPKHIEDRVAIDQHTKEYIHYLNGTHFTLEGYGSETRSLPISTTKRDYPEKIGHPERKEGPRSKYPPIYRDENAKELGSTIYNSEYTLTGAPKTDIVHPNATASHFTLGDDDDRINTCRSVTRSTYKGFDKQPYVEMKKDEQKRSTVLDYPDGEPGERVSVQKSDYRLDKNLDRSSLKVDNTATVKDLRSTHFTLGNDDTFYKKSQYQTSFKSTPSNSAYRHSNIVKEHYRTCVTIRDEDDLEAAKVAQLSTQHRDYQQPDLRSSGSSVQNSRAVAKELEQIHKLSSIPLANDAQQRTVKKSITGSDFKVPNLSAYPSHPKSGIENKYNVLSGNQRGQIDPFHGASIMKTSYIHFCEEGGQPNEEGELPPASKAVRENHAETFEASLKSSKNLRGTHFELGNDVGSAKETSTREAFESPALDAYRNRVCVKAGNEWRFGSTLENTVTRFPNDNETYQTVNNGTYVSHGGFKAPSPFRPAPLSFLKAAAIDNEIRFQSEPSMDGPLLATETKRKFVPPEVMKYQARMEAVGHEEIMKTGRRTRA